MTELRCRHPYSQWGTSLALAMLPFFIDAWRGESPDLPARTIKRLPYSDRSIPTIDRRMS